MFEEADPNLDPVFVPPIPKVVILDLSLVTGMDTSSVDVFQDISVLCNNNDCKLFLSGMNSSLLKTMSLSGFKPETARNRSSRKLRFFSDLEKAVGKAEDMLLQNEGFENHINHGAGGGIRGFEHA
jgi:MFS superfamily sulfate permease-like transporter